jgi:hypothetical protein
MGFAIIFCAKCMFHILKQHLAQGEGVKSIRESDAVDTASSKATTFPYCAIAWSRTSTAQLFDASSATFHAVKNGSKTNKNKIIWSRKEIEK